MTKLKLWKIFNYDNTQIVMKPNLWPNSNCDNYYCKNNFTNQQFDEIISGRPLASRNVLPEPSCYSEKKSIFLQSLLFALPGDVLSKFLNLGIFLQNFITTKLSKNPFYIYFIYNMSHLCSLEGSLLPGWQSFEMGGQIRPQIVSKKNPSYGRQSISWPMRIVAPIPQ